MNAVAAAALVALLAWFGTLILAGAVAEYRRTRRNRRGIARNRPALPRSPAEAWTPRPLPTRGRP